MWYVDGKDEHFQRFLPKGKFIKIKTWRYNRLINKAEKYKQNRKTYEEYLTDEYIDKNIHVLNVKYPVVDKNHFARIDCTDSGFTFYKTSANISGNGAKKIINILIVSLIITLIIGAIAIDLDNELLKNRVLGIFTIIINAVLDIGLTLWQFINCYFHCEKIVRQEDLRSVLDQNELLTEYKKSLSEDLKRQAESEVSLVVNAQSAETA